MNVAWFRDTFFPGGIALAADSNDVANAARKLADQSNYSWKTTVTVRRKPVPSRANRGQDREGRLTRLSMTRGENTTDAVLKATRAIIWKAVGNPWRSWPMATRARGRSWHEG